MTTTRDNSSSGWPTRPAGLIALSTTRPRSSSPRCASRALDPGATLATPTVPPSVFGTARRKVPWPCAQRDDGDLHTGSDPGLAMLRLAVAAVIDAPVVAVARKPVVTAARTGTVRWMQQCQELLNAARLAGCAAQRGARSATALVFLAVALLVYALPLRPAGRAPAQVFAFNRRCGHRGAVELPQ